MDAPDPKGTAERAGAKRAFLDNLDAKLAAAGYPVRAPAPATPATKPTPAPAPTFETWAELSVRLARAPPEDLAAALATRGLTLDVWKRCDEAYRRVLVDDLRTGQRERAAIYAARYKEEQARRARPLLPPAPGAPGEPLAKTAQSNVMPRPLGGETIDLDTAEQRPTPDLPFAGAPGGVGVVHVPPLSARQYVALRAELALQTAPREETRRRYHVPSEAALHALEEQWREPGRRAELEKALADFAVALRGQVLR